MEGIIPLQLAMSSRIQEAANWSWLVPKDLGPKAVFGCSASPAWAELRASAKHRAGCAGYPEDRNLPSCPRHLNVPLEDGPGDLPGLSGGGAGHRRRGRHDSQTMESKLRGHCGHRTLEKNGAPQTRARVRRGWGTWNGLPLPPPDPEAFSKPQAEPYCRSQAKFNF